MIDQRIQEIRARQEAAQLFLLKCDRTNFGCQVPQAVKLIDDDIPYLINLIESIQSQQEQQEPLTFGQLAKMEGQPVYDKNMDCWRVIESVYNPDDDYAIDTESNPHAVISFTDGTEMDFDSDFFYLYVTKPKEVQP